MVISVASTLRECPGRNHAREARATRKVIYRGKFVEKTAAGEHLVKIEKIGYKEWNRTVTLNAGSNITIDANLEKNP